MHLDRKAQPNRACSIYQNLDKAQHELLLAETEGPDSRRSASSIPVLSREVV